MKDESQLKRINFKIKCSIFNMDNKKEKKTSKRGNFGIKYSRFHMDEHKEEKRTSKRVKTYFEPIVVRQK